MARRARPTNLAELKEYYLRWLEEELTRERNTPDHTYSELVFVMFEKEYAWSEEYEWSIPMDDNRLADGLELRAEFAELHNAPRHEMDALGPCSFLEVLLGLSRRLAFIAGGTPSRWAWQLVINLGLERMWDHLSRPKTRTVLDILDIVVKRTYEPNGLGGFFPLAWPDRDQRRVELWYQMNAYAEEQHSE